MRRAVSKTRPARERAPRYRRRGSRGAPDALFLRAWRGRRCSARVYATFAVPGRYVAGRILADSVTIVALSPPAPGLEQDIATIRARCPRVLQPEPAEAAVFFRVQRDDRCLRDGFGEHDAS